MNPSLSAFLSRRLLDRRDGHRAQTLRCFRAYCEHDRLPAQVRKEHRAARLADLLNHYRSNVRRGQALLADTPPATADTAFDVLASLPVMRRAEIQSEPDDYIAALPGPIWEDATGGSTGTPMKFKVDRPAQVAREASLFWGNHLAGWRPGQRIAMLWGSDRDVRSATSRIRLALRWWIENRRWYNAFDMGEDKMAAFHEDMGRFRPHLVVAYAGSIFTLARFLEDRNIRPAYPDLGIVSSAEVTTPEMRAVVERVFQKPVYDRYGNREVGAMAAECSHHGGLHINEAEFILEIDSPDPSHIEGPLVVTCLSNYAMPFLRYDTGDLGIMEDPGPCPCGRESRRLARILGRQSDTIRTPSGNLIHGEYFTHLLYGEDVREFQFVQVDLQTYTLRLVGVPDPTGKREQRLKECFREVLGSDAKIVLEYADTIPILPSGKRKFTLSLLDEQTRKPTNTPAAKEPR